MNLCPPKNWVIALWLNTRVVKCKYFVSQKKMGSIIRSTGTVFYSLLYLNSQQGFNGLKYMYSIISVIVDSLPGNYNETSTRRRGTRWGHGRVPAACCNTGRRPSRAARTASEKVLSESCLWTTPSSWWAPQPGVGRRVSLLTSQTICTIGDRLLNHDPKAPYPPLQCVERLCAKSSQTYSLFYKLCCVSPEVFFANKYNETSTRMWASGLSAETGTTQFTIRLFQLKKLY